MFKKSILLLALLLVGCAQPADKTVEAINKISLPATTAQTASQANPAELQALHSANQEIIIRLTAEIKEEKTQDVRTADILDPHSDVHPAFQALTQLEEINQLNDAYLKQRNKNGLALIEEALKPLQNTTT
ncbi:hypothetical protein MUA01_09595 [Enterobacteriaceae bacterium H18W14]|uniref:hypothetical protein n=1 Tax=Dryocola boscaweniae TaxID=2925397 RepID=UPI0022F0333B|nr:hypothetical protein [Dryocola boscaweniae]MCT4715228.1 hypothetical protein [Dryocola boscaweniae]